MSFTVPEVEKTKYICPSEVDQSPSTFNESPFKLPFSSLALPHLLEVTHKQLIMLKEPVTRVTTFCVLNLAERKVS